METPAFRLPRARLPRAGPGTGGYTELAAHHVPIVRARPPRPLPTAVASAAAGIYPLDITLCIDHVAHPDGGDDLNHANDCQTRVRSLLIESP